MSLRERQRAQIESALDIIDALPLHLQRGIALGLLIRGDEFDELVEALPGLAQLMKRHDE